MTAQIFPVKVLKFYNNLGENNLKVILHVDINAKELIYTRFLDFQYQQKQKSYENH